MKVVVRVPTALDPQWALDPQALDPQAMDPRVLAGPEGGRLAVWVFWETGTLGLHGVGDKSVIR